MKSVYRSIKPYWLYCILIGKKTIEVGKTFPKADDWNKEVFLHCSKDMKSFKRIPEKDREWMRKYLGKVACRFVCDKIEEYQAEFCDFDYEDCTSDGCALNSIRKVIGYDYDNDCPKFVFETSNEEENPDNCEFLRNSGLTLNEIRKYVGETFYDNSFYGWHISSLVIYKNPRELSEFTGLRKTKFGYEPIKIARPPQSWCYVESEDTE